MKNLDANKLMTDAQERVLKSIPLGKDNAVTREELCNELKMSDRKVREIISELRQTELIMYDSGRAGYWKPTNREEVKAFLSQNIKRIKSLHRSCKLARQYLKNHEDQLHA